MIDMLYTYSDYDIMELFRNLLSTTHFVNFLCTINITV